ncbi:MAG: 2-hydroxyacid dehydrogenase, partial [Vibrio sp.]
MLNIAFFSSKSYDEKSFNLAKGELNAEFHFHDFRLTTTTAKMAHDNEVVCAFVNDDLSRDVLEILAQGGTQLIAMRCAGFDKVDLDAAKEFG